MGGIRDTIFRDDHQGLKPDQVERYLSPTWDRKTDRKGKMEKLSLTQVMKNVGQMAWVKINRIVHAILTCEWVRNKSVSDKIIRDIDGLKSRIEDPNYKGNLDDLFGALTIDGYASSIFDNLKTTGAPENRIKSMNKSLNNLKEVLGEKINKEMLHDIQILKNRIEEEAYRGDLRTPLNDLEMKLNLFKNSNVAEPKIIGHLEIQIADLKKIINDKLAQTKPSGEQPVRVVPAPSGGQPVPAAHAPAKPAMPAAAAGAAPTAGAPQSQLLAKAAAKLPEPTISPASAKKPAAAIGAEEALLNLEKTGFDLVTGIRSRLQKKLDAQAAKQTLHTKKPEAPAAKPTLHPNDALRSILERPEKAHSLKEITLARNAVVARLQTKREGIASLFKDLDSKLAIPPGLTQKFQEPPIVNKLDKAIKDFETVHEKQFTKEFKDMVELLNGTIIEAGLRGAIKKDGRFENDLLHELNGLLYFAKMIAENEEISIEPHIKSMDKLLRQADRLLGAIRKEKSADKHQEVHMAAAEKLKSVEQSITELKDNGIDLEKIEKERGWYGRLSTRLRDTEVFLPEQASPSEEPVPAAAKAVAAEPAPAEAAPTTAIIHTAAPVSVPKAAPSPQDQEAALDKKATERAKSIGLNPKDVPAFKETVRASQLVMDELTKPKSIFKEKYHKSIDDALQKASAKFFKDIEEKPPENYSEALKQYKEAVDALYSVNAAMSKSKNAGYPIDSAQKMHYKTLLAFQGQAKTLLDLDKTVADASESLNAAKDEEGTFATRRQALSEARRHVADAKNMKKDKELKEILKDDISSIRKEIRDVEADLDLAEIIAHPDHAYPEVQRRRAQLVCVADLEKMLIGEEIKVEFLSLADTDTKTLGLPEKLKKALKILHKSEDQKNVQKSVQKVMEVLGEVIQALGKGYSPKVLELNTFYQGLVKIQKNMQTIQENRKLPEKTEAGTAALDKTMKPEGHGPSGKTEEALAASKPHGVRRANMDAAVPIAQEDAQVVADRRSLLEAKNKNITECRKLVKGFKDVDRYSLEPADFKENLNSVIQAEKELKSFHINMQKLKKHEVLKSEDNLSQEGALQRFEGLIKTQKEKILKVVPDHIMKVASTIERKLQSKNLDQNSLEEAQATLKALKELSLQVKDFTSVKSSKAYQSAQEVILKVEGVVKKDLKDIIAANEKVISDREHHRRRTMDELDRL